LVNLLQYEIREAEHVISRLVSSRAIICLELNAMSAHLHLLAVDLESARTTADPFNAAFSVARYALPTLPRGYTYVMPRLECSPLGLTSLTRKHQNYGMLYDGYGVICFTLEVRSDSEPAQGAPEMTGAPTNLQSRNFTTGCCSVQPFHKQAVFAWTKRKEGAHLPTVYYTYEQWAVTQLSWLPR
jgi:hypothetical protein